MGLPLLLDALVDMGYLRVWDCWLCPALRSHLFLHKVRPGAVCTPWHAFTG
jgi:hypothetical protein